MSEILTKVIAKTLTCSSCTQPIKINIQLEVYGVSPDQAKNQLSGIDQLFKQDNSTDLLASSIRKIIKP